MAALPEEPLVVDDPGLDGFALGHGIDRVFSSHPPHPPVTSGRATDEVQKPLMGSVHVLRVATGEGNHGLDALAHGISEEAHGVNGERGAPLGVAEHLTDLLEVLGTALRIR
jgi:hypothetical protein